MPERPFGPMLRSLVVAILLLPPLASVAAAAPSGAAPRGFQGPLDCAVPLVDDRCEVWVGGAVTPGGSYGQGALADLAVSPDGDQIFLTGSTGNGIDVVAYDAAIGAPVWHRRHDVPNGTATPVAIAVSPDGSRVFVAGTQTTRAGGEEAADAADIVVLAFDASGTPRWSATYDGPTGTADGPSAIAVAPDGERVYVTGRATVVEAPTIHDDEYDILTLAFEAGTGERLWEALDDAGESDVGLALAVAADGERVFVTGQAGDFPYAIRTLAYDARPLTAGERLWAASHQTDESISYGAHGGIALAPDGSRVFVTGGWATAAYDTASGRRAWAVDHAQSLRLYIGMGVAADPDGKRVFITGMGWGSGGIDLHTETAALDAGTGSLLWEATDQATSHAHSVLALDSGVYVTAWECATFALDPATGVQTWAARYTREWGSPDCWFARPAPSGERIYVGGSPNSSVDGTSWGGFSGYVDYLLLAYDS